MHTLVIEVEDRDEHDSERYGDQGAGRPWNEPPEPEQHGERDRTDHGGFKMEVANTGNEVPELEEEIVSLRIDPKQLVRLA